MLFIKVLHVWYRITRFPRNVWKWRKILLQDEDFDYSYLIDIIKFKLGTMEKFFNSDDTYSKDAKTISEEINHCLELLEVTDNDKEQKSYENGFKYLSENIVKWWG